MDHNGQKCLKMTVFLKFEHFFQPVAITNKKIIDYVTIKDTLTISVKYGKICARTCPKFCGNSSQRSKIPKNYHFSYAFIPANLDHKEKKQLGKQQQVAERHQMSQRYLETTDLSKFKNSCLLP